MRTEITKHPRNKVRQREQYIRDVDGQHEAKGLVVKFEWIGVKNEVEFRQHLAAMAGRPRGRGAPLLHYALELTAHPVSSTGAKRAFHSWAEMEKLGHELISGLHARTALLGYHDLQDLHLLALNIGPTGLALRSYVPNRSNLRRVMVAIADRVESEINEERMTNGQELLISMSEIRNMARNNAGRRKWTERIAGQLDLDQELTVSDLLKAFRQLELRASVDGAKLLVSSTGQPKPIIYELDLFMRGVYSELLKRREIDKAKAQKAEEEKRKRLEAVPYELLVRALTAYHQGRELPKGIEKWLKKDEAGMVEQPILKTALLKDQSIEKDEYVALKALVKWNTQKSLERRISGNLSEVPPSHPNFEPTTP